MNGVIKSITPGESWEGSDGAMYTIDVELQNGVKGQAYAKSNNPWYAQSGTPVMYEENGQTKEGVKKLKIKKPEGHDNNQGGGQTTQPAQGNQTAHRAFESNSNTLSFKDKTILVQVAFKGAIELEAAAITAGSVKAMRYGEIKQSTGKLYKRLIASIEEATNGDEAKRLAAEAEAEAEAEKMRQEIAAEKAKRAEQKRATPPSEGGEESPFEGIEEDVPF